MDLRDKETEGHTQRVTELTLKLAEKMGISQQEQVQIRRVAARHWQDGRARLHSQQT
jgi:HD-GYP domain-containing protein (c-di-GMP phosphodiesterase class II)